MSRKIATTLLLLASSTLTLSQTTSFPAWFAPPHVAASVVGKNADATTYALQCTSSCAAYQNGQGTMVNGPSTAAFTQVWLEEGAAAQKTLIYECAIKSAGGEGDCVVKAGQEGKTGTTEKTMTFGNDGTVVVTAGSEKLGIVIATTTQEVNTTTTAIQTTPAPTPISTSTISIPNNTTSTSSLSGYSNSTTSTRSKTPSSTRSVPFLPSSTQSAPVSANTMGAASSLSVVSAEKISGAFAAVLGVWFAFL